MLALIYLFWVVLVGTLVWVLVRRFGKVKKPKVVIFSGSEKAATIKQGCLIYLMTLATVIVWLVLRVASDEEKVQYFIYFAVVAVIFSWWYRKDPSIFKKPYLFRDSAEHGPKKNIWVLRILCLFLVWFAVFILQSFIDIQRSNNRQAKTDESTAEFIEELESRK